MMAEAYQSWRPIQWAKYEKMWPRISPYFRSPIKLLDVGVGKGWFEDFLIQKGVKGRFVGVDVSEEAVRPRKPYIEYYIGRMPDGLFDIVVCIDALHLLPERNLWPWVADRGALLIALPLRWADLIDLDGAADWGYAGQREIDLWAIWTKCDR